MNIIKIKNFYSWTIWVEGGGTPAKDLYNYYKLWIEERKLQLLSFNDWKNIMSKHFSLVKVNDIEVFECTYNCLDINGDIKTCMRFNCYKPLQLKSSLLNFVTQIHPLILNECFAFVTEDLEKFRVAFSVPKIISAIH